MVKVGNFFPIIENDYTFLRILEWYAYVTKDFLEKLLELG